MVVTLKSLTITHDHTGGGVWSSNRLEAAEIKGFMTISHNDHTTTHPYTLSPRIFAS